MRNALIIGLTAATVAAGIADAAEKKLDGAGIKAALTGARVYIRGGDVQADFRADGTMAVAHVRGSSDTGKWWVEGDRYCRKWNSWAGAEKRCFFLYRDGNKLRFYYPETNTSENGNIAR